MNEKLILYFREWCGYCVRVQDVISELGVDVEQRNIWENEEWKNDLVSGQGSSTVPVLCRITTGGETQHQIPGVGSMTNQIQRFTALLQSSDTLIEQATKKGVA